MDCLPSDETDRLSHARGRISELYDRWHPYFIRFFLKRIANAQDAEDLAHDVFRDALIQLARGNEPRGNPHAWLMGIASHRLADFYARRSEDTRERTMVPALFDFDDEGTVYPMTVERTNPDPDEEINPAIDVVRHVLAQLSPREKRAYVYRYELGLSAKQVEQLGWSKRYYYRIVSEMKKHVRMLLESED